ncbi:C-signal-like [Ruditapes philippinarum]|uniref:C-signal-like n=1 Tax=Ruditapes philippinarum TaxID=129788 RepID=UPI00295B0E5C|nr:C-signal-like [Ruditapes philippinarum]
MDAENEDSIQSAFKETRDLVGPPGLNVLVNNAAINLKKESIIDINAEDLLKTLKVNVVGPAIITKTFLPLLKQAAGQGDGELSWSRAAILNISSILGSIGSNAVGTYYQYRESKAALNQLTKNLCIELSPQGILAVSIHPGWVQTDMGGANASLTKQASVQGMINVFQKLNKESAGKLIAYDGGVIQW